MTGQEKKVFWWLFVGLLLCTSFFAGFAMGEMHWVRRIGASLYEMTHG